jgi:hypothetical protein
MFRLAVASTNGFFGIFDTEDNMDKTLLFGHMFDNPVSSIQFARSMSIINNRTSKPDRGIIISSLFSVYKSKLGIQEISCIFIGLALGQVYMLDLNTGQMDMVIESKKSPLRSLYWTSSRGQPIKEEDYDKIIPSPSSLQQQQEIEQNSPLLIICTSNEIVVHRIGPVAPYPK